MATFSERLKQLRLQSGMSQSDLADKISVNKQTISQYERGVRRPDFETLSSLCDAFNVSSDYMLGKSEVTLRYVDSNGLSLLDGKENKTYYTNPETAEIAQKIFENKEMRALFDAVDDITPDDLEAVYNIALALKRKERFEDD